MKQGDSVMKNPNFLFICIFLITLPINVPYANATIVDYTTATINVNADNIVTSGIVIPQKTNHIQFQQKTILIRCN